MGFKKWLEAEKEQVAAIVVLCQGKALILERGPTAPWMPLKWNLPGGGVDEGEDHAQAAIRECKEEAGIVPGNVRFFTTKNNPTYDIHFFIGETTSQTAKINYESSNYAWVDATEALKYDFVPQIKNVVLAVLNKA